ncbi:zinc ABC transporter substrate-binding protein [Campylobacter sp. IFREMER_LSEM_CL1846]|uniref:metal ABC transporter solute-binding protein, Zn/Mn family n=1 Tax=unclassified Campylobacter TaxID=2593542 RepID=UPI00126AC1F3|nr:MULTISPECIES: zinc ABC transporter substrate-binding protein [unclassified Campylobacter]EAJ5677823.1 cation ABC transporter substrate-binding protein [Campylobacter lari]EAK0444112.1 cation ABC transporter substrate-binding protein [Campylobacter lari]EAK9942805.1 cation ABC transporter substrate-binding protein [Campylobacter lari]EID4795872.1 zinc ABC transporter substrate-binding protein [Campylobacter lari]MCV3433768.1 zinc ABC transporter substrate-binding protein [Campylobacter sp. I
MLKILLLLLSCALAFSKPIVSVSIPPQAFFVEKIAKDSVEINILISPNSNEHNVEFKPMMIKNLEKSKIYFLADLELEKILENKFKNTLKNVKIVNINDGISLLENDETDEHEHDEHEHGKNDPHTWLDPVLVKIQAQNIYKALSQTFPQNKDFYAKNLENFLKELDDLNSVIKTNLQDIKHREFIVYHPSWNYLAKRYNLIQIPVEIDGKEPKIQDLQKLIKIAKEKNIKVIFVQPGFSENSAKVLSKELDAKIVFIDHLAKDWDKELLKTIQALKMALE